MRRGSLHSELGAPVSPCSWSKYLIQIPQAHLVRLIAICLLASLGLYKVLLGIQGLAGHKPRDRQGSELGEVILT